MLNVEKASEQPGVAQALPHWFLAPSSYKETKALFRCSNGHLGAITTHQIEADGTVSPAICCPHARCNFNESIRLVNWQPSV